MMQTAAAGEVQRGPRETSSRIAEPAAALPSTKPASAKLLALLEQVDRGRAYDVKHCGTRFWQATCGCSVRHVTPLSCGDRLCPNCESRRSTRAVKKYGVLFERAEYVRFVTLTMRKPPLGELAETMKKLRRAFRNLRPKFPLLFKGGVYAIETKGTPELRDRPAGWHTHIHVLTYGGRGGYVSQDELAETWARCLERQGLEGNVVDIRTRPRDADGTFTSALQEALKYVTKGYARGDDLGTVENWTPAMVVEFTKATKHARLFQTFGDVGKVAELDVETCECCGETVLPDFNAPTMCRSFAERYLEGRLHAGWDYDRRNWQPSRPST